MHLLVSMLIWFLITFVFFKDITDYYVVTCNGRQFLV